MSLEVRSADERLVRALKVWYEEREDLFAGSVVITDIDSMPALELEGEITCSHTLPATLRRPFSFARLEELLRARREEARGRREEKRGRLAFIGDEAYLDGEKLPLTPAEKTVLRILFEARGPLTSEEIARRAGTDAPRSNKIAVHISFLRAKTEKAGAPRLIFTRRSKGYELEND